MVEAAAQSNLKKRSPNLLGKTQTTDFIGGCRNLQTIVTELRENNLFLQI